jgi:hypothetical protein
MDHDAGQGVCHQEVLTPGPPQGLAALTHGMTRQVRHRGGAEA